MLVDYGWKRRNYVSLQLKNARQIIKPNVFSFSYSDDNDDDNFG